MVKHVPGQLLIKNCIALFKRSQRSIRLEKLLQLLYFSGIQKRPHAKHHEALPVKIAMIAMVIDPLP